MRKQLLPAALVLLLLGGCGTEPPAASPPEDVPATTISLNGASADISGAGAVSANGVTTITESGIYILSGTADDGQVVVDAPGGDVALLLDGVELTCSNGSAIRIQNAASAVIQLEEGTENTLANSSGQEESDACLYSAAGLTLQGEGALEITAGPGGGAGVYSARSLTVAGGRYTVSSEDDGLHADGILTVSGGSVIIPDCYEGLEGSDVVISGGEVRLNSSDDGVNAAGDGDSHLIRITGGTLEVLAGGDGLDANGDIEMTGGTVLVSSTGMSDGALDCDGSFSLSGGVLLAVSGGNMPTAPASPEQNTLSVSLDSAAEAGAFFQISGTDREFVLRFPIDAVHFVFSAPELAEGVYTLTSGGSYDGEPDGLLYTGGTYTGGQVLTRLEVSAPLTVFGERANWGGGMGEPPEGGPFQPGIEPPGNGNFPDPPSPPEGNTSSPPTPPEGNASPPPTPPAGPDSPGTGPQPPQPPEWGGSAPPAPPSGLPQTRWQTQKTGRPGGRPLQNTLQNALQGPPSSAARLFRACIISVRPGGFRASRSCEARRACCPRRP